MIGLPMDEGQRNRRRNASDPDAVMRFHRRLASKPAGRMNIMTMKKAKAST